MPTACEGQSGSRFSQGCGHPGAAPRATVNKQIVSLTPKFHITRHGEEVATGRKKLISPLVDRLTVDIPGPDDLHVTGSIFEHNFTMERQGRVAATVSKQWVALTDTTEWRRQQGKMTS